MFVLYCTCVSVSVSMYLCILYLDGNSVVSFFLFMFYFLLFSSVVLDNLQPLSFTYYLLSFPLLISLPLFRGLFL